MKSKNSCSRPAHFFPQLLVVAAVLLCPLAAHSQGDGTLDTSFDAGAFEPPFPVAHPNVQWLVVQPDGKIVIGGLFTVAGGISRNSIARLNPDGSVDGGFDPGSGGRGAMALQSDGKVIVSQYYLNGYGSSEIASPARLNSDGSLDTSFNSGPPPENDNGSVRPVGTLAVQTDGKVVIGGSFSRVNGLPREAIARLNPNGSLDASFSPTVRSRNGSEVATGFVRIATLQSNGKIIIAGNFNEVNGITRNRMARLNPDGSVDTTFDPGSGAFGQGFGNSGESILAIAIQIDGKIIIGGTFSQVNSVGRNRIARLNADGSLDESFALGSGAGSDVRAWVWAVAPQPDGKTVIGGTFTEVDGIPRHRIARLNLDGSLDLTFDNGSGVGGSDFDTTDMVLALALQTDSKIIIGGQFSEVSGISRNSIARLHGTLRPPGDLLIKEGSEPFAGDNIYQTIPAGVQLRTNELSPGAVLKYTIKLQNETGALDAFRLRSQAPANNTGWAAFRVMFGETDISAAVSSAEGWQTPALPPQGELVVTFEAQPNVAEADETARLQFFLAEYDAPETLDALEINMERSDVIVVNDAGDADDPTPGDGSPDTAPNTDGVQITLRSAINFSNRKTARDTIEFNVAGSSVPVILPATALPPITAPTVLAGNSSAGGKVELDGRSAGEADGLSIQAQDCVIRGFVIYGFSKSGIEIGGAGMNRVEGCMIGTIDGLFREPNLQQGIHIVSPKNTIGGASGQLGSAPGNLISGNGAFSGNGAYRSGIVIEGEQAKENVIVGNLIGTKPTGKSALGNAQAGVLIAHGSNNRIGGTIPTERNIISGNDQFGIVIGGSAAKGNKVLGNFVGTDIDGTAAIPNEKAGIQLETNASENAIGGATSGSRNVIAGNGSAGGAGGISIIRSAYTNTVEGNYIGTDVTGDKALGNNPAGVFIAGGIANVIGGYSIAARNIISGNLKSGVQLGSKQAFEGTGGVNEIVGNFIGPDRTGTKALPNGTAGVTVTKDAGANIIGGSGNVATGRNVISGNQGAGLLFDGIVSYDSQGQGLFNFVSWNYVGTQPNGVTPLPNQGPGVWVRNGSIGVVVGGGAAGGSASPNRIAFNQGPGVFVESGTSVLVVGNSISDNSGLGIALGLQGPVFNQDPADTDEGPNRRQNFPVLETLERLETGSRIRGHLDSRGANGELFLLAFYTSDAANPLGFGDGKTFLGAATVPANPSAPIEFDVTIPAVITPGLLLTATATDQAGNTSQFNLAIPIDGQTQTDTDGISDEVEDQVPNRSVQLRGERWAVTAEGANFGDGNGDGISDSQQDNVASFLGITAKWLTLAAPNGTSLVNVQPGGSPEFDHMPFNYGFAAGFMTFTVAGVTPGGSVAIVNIFHDDFHPTTVFAYGPTPDNPQPHWYEFLYDGATGAQFGDGEMTLHFVDGGRGDHDLQANGQITTTLAPASIVIVYSVTFIDPGGTYSSYYPAITAAVQAAGAEWSRYLVGSANLEVEVTISSSNAGGGYSATSGFVRNDGTRDIFEQGAVYELRTGIDPNGASPDIRISVTPFLLTDLLWFDPQPAQRTQPVPPDRVDAISVFTRWLGGAFVFNGWMNPTTGVLPPTYMSTFDENIQFDGTNFFFVGLTAETRYDGPVPLTYGNIYRLGNNPPRPGSNLLSDLMNGTGVEYGRRYDVSQLDVDLAKDCEVAVTFSDLEPILLLTGAASEKLHGGLGPFSINLPLTGAPGTECRSSGGMHTLVFTFTNEVVSGNAVVTSGTGLAGSPTFAGNTMTVSLSGVADVQKITVTLSNVTDNFAQVLPDTAVNMNVLVGDTTGNKFVDASDVGQTKAQSGMIVTEQNARQDVTANGSIDASDIGLVKSRSGTSIP